MAKTYSMRLGGVAGVDVPHMGALEAGMRRIVGKVEVAPGEWAPSTDPELCTVVCSGMDAHGQRSMYAKCVRNGELVALDGETAEMCGVPFVAPKPVAKPRAEKAGDL